MLTLLLAGANIKPFFNKTTLFLNKFRFFASVNRMFLKINS
ncbi:hypothetical protein JCM19274_4568 [Algibacter lectus]|uniref:Uncharacterized protein n=1 Tax=Algibacter lectus TaxID=221126 RepID=A0A090WRT1_9FLAO|nr:hypothetical protein JCM19274_4568 [Algibacter lectus]